MQLPQIQLLLGTTYRDLHSEREYLLKRTIPLIKRRCEERGILFTLRELKWAEDPQAIALQMNRMLEALAEPATCYLGLRSLLDPPAPAFSTSSTIATTVASTLDKLTTEKASWRQIEEALVREFLPEDRRILVTPPDDKDKGTLYVAEELGTSIEEALDRIIDNVAVQAGIDGRSIETYHQLYLRSRAIGALQEASKADDLIRALAESQAVILLGVTGSGKSTTIALALEALATSGVTSIPYVLDGADTSVRTLAAYITQSAGADLVSSADLFSQLALSLARAGEKIIALDGIEFLDEQSHYLGWLPEPLPANIQIIASTADRKQAEVLEARGWKVIHVDAIEPASIAALIDHISRERNLILSQEQKGLIRSHPLAFHPQFLITLLDELCQFGWFAQLNKNLDEYLDEMSIYQLFNSAKAGAAADTSLPNNFVLSARLQHYLQSHSLVELYLKVLERLEYDFGAPQLSRMLSYLGIASRGLTLDDLAALTGLTISSIQHMLNALGSNISIRSGRVLIGNEYFSKAIEKRYLGSSTVQHALRRSLTHYLRSQQSVLHTIELATQYIASGEREQLRSLLLEPDSLSYLLQGAQFDTLSVYWKATGCEATIDKDYLELLPKYLAIAPVTERVANLRRVADLLLYLGKPAAAHTILDAAIKSTEGLSELRLDRGQLLRSLGRTLYALARYGESETAYKESVETFSSLGSEHEIEALASRKDLASLLAEGARYSEADALYSEIIRDTERLHGEESPQLASVLNAIGLMLNGQGKYDAAISVSARARNIFVHHWGREYPELGWCFHIFATAYRQKGDLDEATQWYTLAIQRFLQLHGEDHPIPLRSMYGLAVLLQKKGDLEGAVIQARKVVQIRTRLLGPKHADTAAAKVLLGSVLKASTQYTESMTLLSEGLEVFDSGANKEHPEVARTLHELGEVYWKLNMTDRSKSVLLRALSIRSKVLGEDHPDTQASDDLMNAISAGGELAAPALAPVKE